MLDCCLRPLQPCPAEGGLLLPGAVFPPASLRRVIPAGACWLVPLRPSAPDAPALLREALAAGAKGVQLICADALALSSPDVQAIAEVCAEKRAILSLRARPPVLFAGARPLQDYLDLAEAFPTLRLLLSDFGGGLAYYEQLRSARDDRQNIYYGCWTEKPLHLPRALTGVPLDKVVYGSAGLRQPPLPPETERILNRNGARLLFGGAK